MSHFDDLPKRDRNRAIEEKAEAAFQTLISQSEDFIPKALIRKTMGRTVRSRWSNRASPRTSGFTFS